MTFEQALSLAGIFKELLSILIWPALILTVLLKFSREIGGFFEGMSELTFKAGGVEATAKKKQIEAAAALGAAYGKSPNVDHSMKPINKISSKIADIVESRITSRNVKNIANASILWVDDRPENNIYERKAMETLGVKFYVSKSTEDALQKLQKRSFSLIISDMGRPQDDRAGYTLLEEVRNSGNDTPFLLYTGSNAPKHKAEAINRGAQGSTNDPNELFELVLTHIA